MMKNLRYLCFILVIICIGTFAHAVTLPLEKPDILEKADWVGFKTGCLRALPQYRWGGVRVHLEAFQSEYERAYASERKLAKTKFSWPLLNQFLVTQTQVVLAIGSLQRNPTVPDARVTFDPVFRWWQRTANTILSHLHLEGKYALSTAGGVLDFRNETHLRDREIGLTYVYDRGGIVTMPFQHKKGYDNSLFFYGDLIGEHQRGVLTQGSKVVNQPGIYMRRKVGGLMGCHLEINGYTGVSVDNGPLSRGRSSSSAEGGGPSSSAEGVPLAHAEAAQVAMPSFCRYRSTDILLPSAHPMYVPLSATLEGEEAFLAFPQTKREADMVFGLILEEALATQDERVLRAVTQALEMPTLAQIAASPDYPEARDFLGEEKAAEEEGKEKVSTESQLLHHQVQTILEQTKEDLRTSALPPLEEPKEEARPKGPKQKTRGKADLTRAQMKHKKGAPTDAAGGAAAAEATRGPIDVDGILEEVMDEGRMRFRDLAKLFSSTRRALGEHGDPFISFVSAHARYKKHLTMHLPGEDVATLKRPHGQQDDTAPVAHAKEFMHKVLTAFSESFRSPSADMKL